MQTLNGAGAANVQQTGCFVMLLLFFFCAHKAINCTVILAGGGQGTEEQLMFALSIQSLLPHQQFVVIAAGDTIQSGNNERIKFQALGVVDGHDLQARVSICARFGIKLFYSGGEFLPVANAAPLVIAIEQRKITGGIVIIVAVEQNGGSAEREPDAFNPLPDRFGTPLTRGRGG